MSSPNRFRAEHTGLSLFIHTTFFSMLFTSDCMSSFSYYVCKFITQVRSFYSIDGHNEGEKASKFEDKFLQSKCLRA